MIVELTFSILLYLPVVWIATTKSRKSVDMGKPGVVLADYASLPSRHGVRIKPMF